MSGGGQFWECTHGQPLGDFDTWHLCSNKTSVLEMVLRRDVFLLVLGKVYLRLPLRSVWSCPLSWLCVCPGKNSPGANPAGQRKRPVVTAFVRRKGSRPQLTPSPSGLSPAGDHKQHHHPEHDFHQDLAEVWAVG